MEIGRLCVKVAGRDAGRMCVVVDTLENNFVLIDGDVRRRKCNILHLEPLPEVLNLKKGASHADIAKEFKKLGIAVWETKSKKKTEKSLPKRRSEKSEKVPVEDKKQKTVKKEKVK